MGGEIGQFKNMMDGPDVPQAAPLALGKRGGGFTPTAVAQAGAGGDQPPVGGLRLSDLLARAT